jgi:hypothetical protein
MVETSNQEVEMVQLDEEDPTIQINKEVMLKQLRDMTDRRLTNEARAFVDAALGYLTATERKDRKATRLVGAKMQGASDEEGDANLQYTERDVEMDFKSKAGESEESLSEEVEIDLSQESEGFSL